MTEKTNPLHKRKREPLAKGIAERWVAVWVDRHELEVDVPTGLDEEARKAHVLNVLREKGVTQASLVALYVDQERARR